MSGATQTARRPDAHLEPAIHHSYSRSLVLAALMAALRFDVTFWSAHEGGDAKIAGWRPRLGIRTPWIDALTFGLGSGVAGWRASR